MWAAGREATQVRGARVEVTVRGLGPGEYLLSWSSGEDVYEMPFRCSAGEVNHLRADPATARSR